jgi:G3E family GTPase
MSLFVARKTWMPRTEPGMKTARPSHMLGIFRTADAGPFGRRVRHARGGKIPVVVVTGFLGAGKTTLIRRFLASPEGRGTAVIVNEFGAVGIDDQLVRSSADATVLLGNGCLCCATRSDLQLVLRRLVADRERGFLPHFGRVLIETSGLADPSPILQTFSTDRALGVEFHLDALVTLMDAAAGLATLGWSPEMRRQIVLADRIILTKTDLAGAAEADALAQRLRVLNPRAAIDAAIDGALDPCRLVAPAEFADPHPGFAAEAAHGDGIASFVLAPPEPVVWSTFARTMDTLIALRGADLLRVKGFLDVEGCRGPVLVQFVQHLAHPPIELDAWPDAHRASRLVFITRDLAESSIRELFDAVAKVAPASAAL